MALVSSPAQQRLLGEPLPSKPCCVPLSCVPLSCVARLCSMQMYLQRAAPVSIASTLDASERCAPAIEPLLASIAGHAKAIQRLALLPCSPSLP